MGFRNKFSPHLGLQKPPAVCHKTPPPPLQVPGCPLELGPRIDWWLRVQMSTQQWPDYFNCKVTTRRFGPLQSWGGLISTFLDKDGPPRNVSTAIAFTYDNTNCSWQLAIAFGDDHIAFSGDADLKMPLLDTLPQIIHTTIFIIGDYSGYVEVIGEVVPDV